MAFTIIVTVIGLIGAVVTFILVAKEGKERRRWHRWGPVVVALCPILAMPLQVVQQACNDTAHSNELSNARREHTTLMSQNDALRSQIDGLTSANNELRDMLSPVVAMAKEKNPTSEDREAVRLFANQIREIMNPKLAFLEDRTRTKKEGETGLWTIYTWRSRYPVAVRDVSVKLRFDVTILKSAFNLVNMLPYSGNATLLGDPDHKGVRFHAKTLDAGCDLVISVLTETPPKMLSSEVSP